MLLKSNVDVNCVTHQTKQTAHDPSETHSVREDLKPGNRLVVLALVVVVLQTQSVHH